MSERIPRFPEDFTRKTTKIDKEIIDHINEAIRELWTDQGSGLNSVILKPGFILINRDPMQQLDKGKIIVIIQETFTADFTYE